MNPPDPTSAVRMGRAVVVGDIWSASRGLLTKWIRYFKVSGDRGLVLDNKKGVTEKSLLISRTLPETRQLAEHLLEMPAVQKSWKVCVCVFEGKTCRSSWRGQGQVSSGKGISKLGGYISSLVLDYCETDTRVKQLVILKGE